MRFRFAVITDAHFGPRARHEGRLRKLGEAAEPLTRAFTADLAGASAPNAIINLGDVVEDESPEADLARYRSFVDILAAAGPPVIHVAGNHDSVHLSDETLAGLWGQPGPLHYTRDIGPMRFVVLRTVQHARDIELPAEQVAWLGETLGSSPRPTIVLAHHPLSDQVLEGNPWFQRQPALCRVANRREVRKVIAKHPQVIAVLNGHVHWNHFDLVDGVPHVTVQSLIENVMDDMPGQAAEATAMIEIERRRMHVWVRGAQPVRYQIELARTLDG